MKFGRDFLGDRKIGTMDDFIELGGTSLLAIEVVTATNAAFGTNLGLAAFLEAKTVAMIAREVDKLAASREAQFMRQALAEIQGKSDKELAEILQSA